MPSTLEQHAHNSELDVETILASTHGEFKEWSKHGLGLGVFECALLYLEWKRIKKIQFSTIDSVESFCLEAGITREEFPSLSLDELKRLSSEFGCSLLGHTRLVKEHKQLLLVKEHKQLSDCKIKMEDDVICLGSVSLGSHTEENVSSVAYTKRPAVKVQTTVLTAGKVFTPRSPSLPIGSSSFGTGKARKTKRMPENSRQRSRGEVGMKDSAGKCAPLSYKLHRAVESLALNAVNYTLVGALDEDRVLAAIDRFRRNSAMQDIKHPSRYFEAMLWKTAGVSRAVSSAFKKLELPFYDESTVRILARLPEDATLDGFKAYQTRIAMMAARNPLAVLVSTVYESVKAMYPFPNQAVDRSRRRGAKRISEPRNDHYGPCSEVRSVRYNIDARHTSEDAMKADDDDEEAFVV